MKRSFVYLTLTLAIGVALGFALGRACASRQLSAELHQADILSALDRTASLQFVLTMLEQQRSGELPAHLERRLVQAIHDTQLGLRSHGPLQAVGGPNLRESVRRAGLYLERHGGDPSAVEQANWIVAQLQAPSS